MKPESSSDSFGGDADSGWSCHREPGGGVTSSVLHLGGSLSPRLGPPSHFQIYFSLCFLMCNSLGALSLLAKDHSG